MIAPRITIGVSMKRAVLYLRVSTLDQTTANQERELRQVANRAGWEVVHVYKDPDPASYLLVDGLRSCSC
jgi:hypothetical protein